MTMTTAADPAHTPLTPTLSASELAHLLTALQSSGLRVEATVGYAKDEKRYTYQSFSNDGTSHVQYGYALGAAGIVFTDERNVAGQPVRLTTSMIPQSDGRLFLTQQRSISGGPWEQAGEVYYVARK